MKTNDARSLAAVICKNVIENGRSLDDALNTIPDDYEPADRAFVQKLSFGVIRWYWQLDEDSRTVLKKPPRKKDSIIRFILLLGIYQIKQTNIPPHAAVSATVKCCSELGVKWSKGLINACLRNYQRQQATPFEHDTSLVNHAHPDWLATKIQQAWPEHANTILANNNKQAAPCLRINTKAITREDYLKLLAEREITASADPYSPIGIRLERSTAVRQLPHFDQGWVSMQDTASQVITNFFTVKSQQRVLDACSAPGGKTALLIEQSPNDIAVDAVDIGGKRNQKLLSTLARLNAEERVRIIEGDASKPDEWWDGQYYDRILLDAPCSGLGVIRRHPDIKHHRSLDDIEQLKQLQQAILKACWKILKPGGELLYTTCSILPEENVQQMTQFISEFTDASALAITHPTALKQAVGMQALPGVSDMDGFYYCHLRKAAE